MTDLDSMVDAAGAAFAQRKRPQSSRTPRRSSWQGGPHHRADEGPGALSVEEKKTRGAAINVAKQAIESALTDRRQQLADAELSQQLRPRRST
jgi:phenylalanyl-tRNA synthetase alpha chain